MKQLIPGIVAVIAWHLYATFFSKQVLNISLKPEILINNLLNLNNLNLSLIIHLLVGIIIYPYLYRLLKPLISQNLSTKQLVHVLVFGIITWVIALGIFNPLAGGSLMNNFNRLTWSSLAGHLIYSIPIVYL